MLVTCGGCNLKFNRHVEPSEHIGSKWYHERCAEEAKAKKELAEYICQLFNLKKAGPMNYSMIKKMIEQKGYTYKGIYNSLKYYYEIKGGDKNKSEERIGIVPFVYEEAQKYFSIIERKQQAVDKSFEESKKEEPAKEIVVNMDCQVKKAKKQKQNNLPEYDLTQLL